MSEYTLYSPVKIERPKSKDFAINLNIYRNTHYKSLNALKIKYKALMASQIKRLPLLNVIEIHYKLFPKTKRLCDINNIISITDKWFCDALVELGRLKEDNYLYIPRTTSEFGGVDKDDPRVEITIKEI